MEETVLIVFSLLAAMVLLVALANRLRIPYPILLVVAGLVISLIPVARLSRWAGTLSSFA